MNIEIVRKPGCEVEVKATIPGETVDAEWERILGEFCQHARMPGFRPGKAPRNVVERRYRKAIHEELTRELVGRGLRAAIKDNNLEVLRLAKVDDVVIAEDKSMTFSTTMVTAPQFDLPEYKGLTLPVPPDTVHDEEVDEALDNLRGQFAEYPEVEGRPLALEDYAVLDYSATCGGRPLEETAPEAAKFFGENKDFWLRVVENAFLPGFVEAILGMEVGGTRQFDISIADDFPRQDLRGLSLQYKVTLKGIRTQVLPELNDEFAAKVGKDLTLDDLRREVREDLQREKKRRQERVASRAAIDQITSRVEFDLPGALVKEETRRLLEDMVEENRRRGVSDDELASHKDELVAGAERAARANLKTRFILLKIAEAEKIEATDGDLEKRILFMAYRWRMKPQQVRKELEKNDAIPGIKEEILVGKALDFVVSQSNLQVDESLANDQDDHDGHAH